MPIDTDKFMIGITGFPGCGKTTLSNHLATFGAVNVIDMDGIGHDLLEEFDSDLVKEIINHFGKEQVCISEDLISRRKLGDLVFFHEKAKENLTWLNALMWPVMNKIVQEKLQVLKGVCIIDTALLFESGADKMCDLTIFLDIPFDVRFERVSRSRGWRKETLERIDAAQSLEAKMRANLVLKEVKL